MKLVIKSFNYETKSHKLLIISLVFLVLFLVSGCDNLITGNVAYSSKSDPFYVRCDNNIGFEVRDYCMDNSSNPKSIKFLVKNTRFGRIEGFNVRFVSSAKTHEKEQRINLEPTMEKLINVQVPLNMDAEMIRVYGTFMSASGAVSTCNNERIELNSIRKCSK